MKTLHYPFSLKSIVILNVLGLGIGFLTGFLAYYTWFGMASFLVLLASVPASIFFVSLALENEPKTNLLIISSFLLMMAYVLGGFWLSYQSLFLSQGKIAKNIDIQHARLYAQDYTFFQFPDYQIDTSRIAFQHHKVTHKNSSPSYTDYFAAPMCKNLADKKSEVWFAVEYGSSSMRSSQEENRQKFRNALKIKYLYFAKYSNDAHFKDAISGFVSQDELPNVLILQNVASFEAAKEEKWGYLAGMIKIINISWLLILFIDWTYLKIKYVFSKKK